MTKIFAKPQIETVEKPPYDEKQAKTEEEVYTVIKPTILPISIPTHIIKTGRKCHCSWIIGLILLLWVLATTAIIFHLAPDCVYRKLNQLTHHTKPEAIISERFIFDIAEPDMKMAPKLSQMSQPSSAIDGSISVPSDKLLIDGKMSSSMNIDGDAEKANEQKNLIDGEFGGKFDERTNVEDESVKKPSDGTKMPDEDDATDAIRTLLKRPEVQQVVIVGRNDDDSQNDQAPKGVIVLDGSTMGKNGAVGPADIIAELQNNRGILVPADQFIDDSEQPINPMQLAVEQSPQPIAPLATDQVMPSIVSKVQQQIPPQIPPPVSSPIAPPLTPAAAPPAVHPVPSPMGPPMSLPIPPQMPDSMPPPASVEYQRELFKFHRALMQWLMEREMFRRHLLMRLERERMMANNDNEMPNFMLGPPQPQSSPELPQQAMPMMMYHMPMPMFHMMFLPQQQLPLQTEAEAQPSQNTSNDDDASTKKVDHQFPVQMESDRRPMIPQPQMVITEPEQPVIPQTPELPMVRPHDASADQILSAMQADLKVDRDAIFRRLLAQSQIENNREEQEERKTSTSEQQSDNTENRDEVFWNMQQIAQNMNQQQEMSSENSESKQEKAHDEIFRELRQKSLEFQREREAAELSAQQEQAAAVMQQTTPMMQTTEMPVIMIADTFPRRSTVAEPEQPKQDELMSTTVAPSLTTTQPDETIASISRSDPLAAFFRFFQNEAIKLNQEVHPVVEDITASNYQSTTQIPVVVPNLDETSALEVDQPEPVVGTSPVEAETLAPQSSINDGAAPIPTSSDEQNMEMKDEQSLPNIEFLKRDEPLPEMPIQPILRVVA